MRSPWFAPIGPLAAVATLALAVLPGCPADPSDDADDGANETGEDTTGGGTTSDGTIGGSGQVDSTGGEDMLLPARNITIDLVEANQGVAVDLARNGTWLGPAERQAPILQNRIALVRALYVLGGGWEPREIEAHLELRFPDGTTETKIDSKQIADEAFIGDLDRAFFWGVEAEKMVPGLEFRVELFEVDDAMAGTPEPDPPPSVPQSDGFEVFGIESSYQVMKVVVVPFNYDNGGCTTEPDTSPETMQAFQDHIYMQNPLDRLDYELHEPLTFTGEATAFNQLNQILVDLRFDEGALPETYYYGLIDVCMGGLGGAGGQANGIPPDPVNPDVANARVSSGLWIDLDFSKETIVHEIGHSQGRAHVFCNGEEGGPDPSYPHKGGVVNEWGFGVVDFVLRHPTVNKDYMTYCHPTWVGNWGWNKVYPTIRGLSEWDADFPGNGKPYEEDPYSGSMLIGWVDADGNHLWSTVPGGLAGAPLADGESIELTLEDGTTQSVGARVEPLPDSPGSYKIEAPIPDELALTFEQVRTLTRVTQGQRVPIPRADIHEHHHQRTVRRVPDGR